MRKKINCPSINKLIQILRKVSNNKQLCKKNIHPKRLITRISLFGMLTSS